MDKNSRTSLKKIMIVIMILFGLFIVFEVWRSYNCLVVNTYNVQDESIETPVKLVVLGDLHDCTLGEKNEDLIMHVEEQKPDLILMAGDMLNEDSENAGRVLYLIEELSQTAPVYYALGNHELAYIEGHPGFYEEIESAGVVMLEKSYQDITIGGSSLRIGGMYEYAFGLDWENTAQKASRDVQTFLEEFGNTSAYKILISHRPDSFVFGNASEYWDVDLVVSAHNHGGQVVLPFVGGLYGGDQGWFPKYIHGLYELGEMQLFVTSGLGSERQLLPRWNNPPEVAVIQLALR